MAAPASGHSWRFFRSGGFDHVAIETAADLLHLDALDPKLWSALSCPAAGLEFDTRTLALLDVDQDGQIRVPELLAAVRWACRMLKDPQCLFDSGGLPLSAISETDPDAISLRAAAARVLEYLKKPSAAALCVEDFADLTQLFAPGHFNGDGVVTAALTESDQLQQLIKHIIATQGEIEDRSGAPGVNAATLTAFLAQAQAVRSWRAAATADAEQILPLGAATAAAAEAFAAVRDKVNDFFVRVQLAGFDVRAIESLNTPTSAFAALAEQVIAADDGQVAALPLAAITARAALPLGPGLNPAWAGAIERLRDSAIVPLLGKRDTLTAADWAQLAKQLAPYQAWVHRRPETGVHDLDAAELETLTAAPLIEALTQLIERDLAAETSAATIDGLEKLVRLQRDLVTLLRNFVTLSDFYGGERKAIFQAGTLYLDQRSCDLVMRVADMAAHANLAPYSGCYLIYCDCERANAAPITIVAALTGGEVDELMVPGRHGVFYDRAGRDWKATVVRIVAQPVSIRQAFWSPYRRVGTFIENQIRNFAASRDKDIQHEAQAGVVETAARAEAPTAAPAAPFDIARFAGIFAAIGLAVGAIGTTLVAAISGLFALAWWQVPIAIAGIMLAISGPSIVLAWLTLRRRNLGPLLDANGWAVNARARINIAFGGSLTGVATLPAGSRRSLIDPFADRKRPWKTGLFLLLVVAAVVVTWQQGWLARLTGG
jgi:hypothetical protein